MKIREALVYENIEYREFYNALESEGIGYWDGINSTDIIHEYVKKMIDEYIDVSHILQAIEQNESEFDDWAIWLGNSMETPSPINSKQDLLNALRLDGNADLEAEIKL